MTRRSATGPAMRLAMTQSADARERTAEIARREALIQRLRHRGMLDAQEARLLGDDADRQRLTVAIGAAYEMADALVVRRAPWREVALFVGGVVVGVLLAVAV